MYQTVNIKESKGRDPSKPNTQFLTLHPRVSVAYYESVSYTHDAGPAGRGPRPHGVCIFTFSPWGAYFVLDAVLKQATKVQRQTNKTPRNEQVTAHDQATPSVGSSGSSQHQRLQAASGAWARGKAGASGHAHSAVREMMADEPEQSWVCWERIWTSNLWKPTRHPFFRAGLLLSHNKSVVQKQTIGKL